MSTMPKLLLALGAFRFFMSAIERITDSSQTLRHVREVLTRRPCCLFLSPCNSAEAVPVDATPGFPLATIPASGVAKLGANFDTIHVASEYCPVPYECWRNLAASVQGRAYSSNPIAPARRIQRSVRVKSWHAHYCSYRQFQVHQSWGGRELIYQSRADAVLLVHRISTRLSWPRYSGRAIPAPRHTIAGSPHQS
jgi:hypothetical protein